VTISPGRSGLKGRLQQSGSLRALLLPRRGVPPCCCDAGDRRVSLPEPPFPFPSFLTALAVERATDVFVVHSLFGTEGSGALFSVSPSSGLRTIISDFGDATQGPSGGSSALAVRRGVELRGWGLGAGGSGLGAGGSA
jgi:hypothetical protein